VNQHFECVAGAIPTQIGRLVHMTSLNLSSNQLGGACVIALLLFKEVIAVSDGLRRKLIALSEGKITLG
jgi:hypothetical protein